MVRVKALSLCIVFMLSLLCQPASLTLGEQQYDTSMDVRDEPPNDLWWLEDQPSTGDNPPGLMEVTERLASLLFVEKRADLRAVYGSCFINPGNSTLFLVITDCRANTVAKFDEALAAPPDVYIIYRKGPATYAELEGYMNALKDVVSGLPKDVIRVNNIGITENATILIGISEVNAASVGALSKAFEGIVPEEVVVIRRMGEVTLTPGEAFAIAIVPAFTNPVAAPRQENPGPVRTADDTADDFLTPLDQLVVLLSVLIPLMILIMARKSLD